MSPSFTTYKLITTQVCEEEKKQAVHIKFINHNSTGTEEKKFGNESYANGDPKGILQLSSDKEMIGSY
jgi:hypothetical protein